MAVEKSKSEPPKKPLAVWVVAQEVCEKLSPLSRDDRRRALAACATLLGIYEEKDP